MYNEDVFDGFTKVLIHDLTTQPSEDCAYREGSEPRTKYNRSLIVLNNKLGLSFSDLLDEELINQEPKYCETVSDSDELADYLIGSPSRDGAYVLEDSGRIGWVRKLFPPRLSAKEEDKRLPIKLAHYDGKDRGDRDRVFGTKTYTAAELAAAGYPTTILRQTLYGEPEWCLDYGSVIQFDENSIKQLYPRRVGSEIVGCITKYELRGDVFVPLPEEQFSISKYHGQKMDAPVSVKTTAPAITNQMNNVLDTTQYAPVSGVSSAFNPSPIHKVV